MELRRTVPWVLAWTLTALGGVALTVVLRPGEEEPPKVLPMPTFQEVSAPSPTSGGSPTALASGPRCRLADLAPAGGLRGGAGGALSLSPDERTAVVTDSDDDSLVVLAVTHDGARATRRFRVGSRPAQVVLGSDGRAFVTERGSNQLAVYDTRDGSLKCRAEVAGDPYGVALAPDERTVYVTSGITRTLTALDTDTLSPRGTVTLPREPRGVLAAPDGHRVFVSHLAGAPLSAVEVSGTLRAVELPGLPIPAEHDAAGSRVEPLPSQAWSLALEPVSARVVVPFMVSRTGREVPVVQRVDAYGAGSVEPEQGEKTSFTVALFDPARNLWEAVHSRRAMSARAIAGSPRVPSAVAVRPTDGTVFVASMGTGEVLPTIVARASTNLPVPGTSLGHPQPVPSREGRRGPRPRTGLGVGVSPAEALSLAAPCGVAVTREGAVLAYSQVEHAVEFRGAGGRLRSSTGSESLAPDIARGRRLFYTANDPRLSSGGLSCGGCHPDGRDDGLTWFLSHGPRQTPTLAGRLVTPFNWVGSARSVEANIAQTIHRLGGTGITIMEVDALAAFLQRGLVVPSPRAPTVTAEVTRGRALFHGIAGCNTCHDPGRNFTDGQLHELGGQRPDDVDHQFDTPSLRYVSATAPYFHDGRYASLRAMLTDPSHRMGHVDVLTPRDVDALTAYLETL